MVLHELVDCTGRARRLRRVAVLGGAQARHELCPVGLNDLCRAKVQELLHKDEHSGSQRPGSALPYFQGAVLALVSPAHAARLGLPGG